MTVGKIIDPNAALNAYKTALNSIDQAAETSGKADETEEGSGSSGGGSFASFLKGTARGLVDTLKSGEKMSAQAITGKADITDVVQAVTAAEISLQTVVAVRDRMIAAYQDIMRMPI